MILRAVSRTLAVVGLVCVLAAAHAGEPYADAAFVPTAAKSSPGVPPVDLERCLEHVQACHVFTTFEGQNDSLKATYLPARDGPLRGGETESVDMAAGALFGPPLPEDGMRVWLASVVSVDAQALRLRVDLSRLRDGEWAWVVDPVGLHAFGPYGAGDEEAWLATVQGDEAVIMVCSPYETVPQVRLTAYAHIFLTFHEILKELECNLDIACETDAAILEASSGVGIINVAGYVFCSGSLINNEQTDDLEPFFVTANHCVCSREQAHSTEVFWDFRASECGLNYAPVLAELPRSNGDALLATSAKLDATLIRLDTVPVGDYGRAYPGWDARKPEENDPVLCIHHPDATRMRVSKGTVRETDQTQNGREHQTVVLWSQGVTENGSSGSALLFADTLRVAGMLSQGPVHSCQDPSGNFDWFASLRHFYPCIQQYIDTPTPSTDEGEDDCRSPGCLCPFVIAFNDYPELLGRFRAFRDDVLVKSAAGRHCVASYYRAAPAIAEAVRRSASARNAFAAITAPLAAFLGVLPWPPPLDPYPGG